MEDPIIMKKSEIYRPPIWVLIAYSLMLVIYVIIDLIWKQSLYDSSVSLSVSMRKSVEWLELYFWFFSRVMYDWHLLIYVILILVMNNKPRALFYSTLFWVEQGTRISLMMIYRDRRPCWDIPSNTINAPECKCGYGKPSGHAATTTMLYAILFYEFFLRRIDISSIKRYFVIGLFWIITWSVMISRIYFAAHTYSHVIIAHLMSSFMMLLAIQYESKAEELFLEIIRFKYKAYIASAVSTIWVALIVIIWLVSDEVIATKTPDNTHYQGVCKECFDDANIDSYGKKLLVSTSQMMIIPAVYFVIAFRNKGKYIENPNHLSSQTWGNIILRLLILSLMNSLSLIAPVILKFNSIGPKTIISFLSVFTVTFISFFFTFDIFKRLGLYFEGEIIDDKQVDKKSNEKTKDCDIKNEAKEQLPMQSSHDESL